MSDGRLAVVGAGRMGRSLAADLAGTELFSSIRLVGREAAPGSANGPPDVLLFCVPDDRLSAAATAWAEAVRAAAGTIPAGAETLPAGAEAVPAGAEATASGGAHPRIALHTSGLHAADILQPLRAHGWRVGSWHPLVAIAAPREGAFVGVTVGLEGDAEAVALGERLASALGARPLPLRAEEKAHYHAGAVFASNFLVACLAVARREISRAAVEEAGPEHLLPLARSALENVALRGLAGGATGPVARGDVGTVERHLAALDERAGALYRALASELLRETEAEAMGADDAREHLTRLLEGGLPQPAD